MVRVGRDSPDASRFASGEVWVSRPYVGRFLMLLCAQGTQYAKLPKKHLWIGRDAYARGVRWSAGVPFLHFKGREKNAMGQWREQEYCAMFRFWDGSHEISTAAPSGSLPGAQADDGTPGSASGVA